MTSVTGGAFYSTAGGMFLQNDPVEAIEWGSGRFIPVDCDHMNFDFESDLEQVSDTVPLMRLTGNCYKPPGEGRERKLITVFMI